MNEHWIDTQLNNTALNLQEEIELAKVNRERWLYLAGLSGVAGLINGGPKSLVDLVADINNQGEFNWQRVAAITTGTVLISILCELARRDHVKLNYLKHQERIRQAYRAL